MHAPLLSTRRLVVANSALITASHIRYLLVLRKLDKDANGIRSVDVVNELGFAKSSIHDMLNVLMRLNLVKKELRGHIFFTELGYKTSQTYERYYYIIKERLFDREYNDTCIDNAICAMLAEIPEQCLDELI